MPIVVTTTSGTQQLLFDPTDEGTGDELDVMADPYALVEFSAPAPPAEFSWAGSMDTEGEAKAAGKHQNRRVTLVVEVSGATIATRDAALDALAAKVAKVFREGGTLRKVTETGDYRTLDLLAADAYEHQFDITYYLAPVARVTIGLLAKPYARGPEVDLGSFSETSAAALIFTVDTADVGGDIPALVEVTATEGTGQHQSAVIAAVQNEHYDSATTAKLLFANGDLTMGGGGVVTSVAGPAGTTGGSTYFLQTGLADTEYTIASGLFTHVGSFRVLARVYAPNTNTGTMSVRLGWVPRRSNQTIYNDTISVDPSLENKWIWIDLGMVRGTESPYDSGWLATFYGTASVAGDDLYFDDLLVIPADEGFAEYLNLTNSSANEPLRSSGDIIITSRGTWTEFSTGWYIEPPLSGDHLTLPVGGATSRIFIKGFRDLPVTTSLDLSEVQTFAGDLNDDLSATLTVTPRYLSVV